MRRLAHESRSNRVSSRKLKIMLVEEQPAHLQMLDDALSRHCHETIRQAGADEELLQAMERQRPDAVLIGCERIRSILEAALQRGRELQQLREELQQTRLQLSERKLVERAKGILMKKRGLSEDLAYQALRKMAMDRNLKLVELARSVIAAADLLD